MNTLLADTYERSHQHLCRVAERYAGGDAEDLVHDAFVRALQSGGTFRHEAAPATWLHRMVVNVCIDRWRCRQRRSHIELESVPPNAQIAACDDPLAAIIVRRALKSLSHDDQHLCILYYVMGYSHREIAAALDIRPTTAKSRLHAMRKRLRREFA